MDRQPFPGPGLAVRILGEVTAERVDLLQQADLRVQEEIRKLPNYDDIWQSFAVLLPVQSVGVMGDERTYENVVAVRAVQSLDGMTADWVRLPYDTLDRIASPHHQRGARHQPRGLRHQLQAAQHHRVGVRAMSNVRSRMRADGFRDAGPATEQRR